MKTRCLFAQNGGAEEKLCRFRAEGWRWEAVHTPTAGQMETLSLLRSETRLLSVVVVVPLGSLMQQTGVEAQAVTPTRALHLALRETVERKLGIRPKASATSPTGEFLRADSAGCIVASESQQLAVLSWAQEVSGMSFLITTVLLGAAMVTAARERMAKALVKCILIDGKKN